MEIRRDVYVLRDRIKDPIEYVQGTDEIPIVFLVRDYHIPEDAFVSVMVEKPSGKAVYHTVTDSVQNNAITIEPTKQMMAEAGTSKLQIEVVKDEKTLATFTYLIKVQKSLFKIDSENGSNFFDEMLKKAQQVITYMENLGKSLVEAAKNGKFSATIEVGETQTLSPGSEAVVTNAGTKQDVVLMFGIPQGKQGEIGPKGEQGRQGEKGEKGEPGADGTAVVTEITPGMFAMSISAEGHLIVTHHASEAPPPLKIVDGHLKYIIGEA